MRSHRSAHRGTTTAAIATIAVAGALAACGGDDTGTIATPTPTPAVTATSPSATRTVSLYLPNDERGDPCTEVFPVEREVDVAADASATVVARATLDALLAGPTEAEVAEGFGGWFSADTAGLVEDVEVADGRAEVSFDASLPEVIPNASSSCGSSVLLLQLDTTLTQLPGVDDARYTLGGDADAFYQWLQMDTPS